MITELVRAGLVVLPTTSVTATAIWNDAGALVALLSDRVGTYVQLTLVSALLQPAGFPLTVTLTAVGTSPVPKLMVTGWWTPAVAGLTTMPAAAPMTVGGVLSIKNDAVVEAELPAM